jgi:thymidylate synthase (FAD)
MFKPYVHEIMMAKVIHYSKSQSDQTLSDMVCFCARVSNPESQQLAMNNAGLIRYLIRHQHWSPFEMVTICMEIHTTRDIARQILRHRSFSFQEFSQRYAPVSEFSCREARLQDLKNRQSSLETSDETLCTEWDTYQQRVLDTSKEAYQWALDHGIAKEQARAVLPEGMTVSVMYMSGTLRSWIHYIQLRTHVDTQKEHRLIATSCLEQLSTIFPEIVDCMK